jgi:hypothetical protein
MTSKTLQNPEKNFKVVLKVKNECNISKFGLRMALTQKNEADKQHFIKLSS